MSSLIKNLEYNERRQKDSIKLFEISNLYGVEGSQNQSRKIGIITTGRVDHNYRDFNRFIDKNYMTNILSGITDHESYIQEISRSLVDSKNKTKIYYAEFNIEDINFKFKNESIDKYVNFEESTFKEISNYPWIYRDLSFLVKDSSSIETLFKTLESFEEDILIERFKKWGLFANVIGEVISKKEVIISQNNQVVAQIPTSALSDETPVNIHNVIKEPPQYLLKKWKWSEDKLPLISKNKIFSIKYQKLYSLSEIILELLSNPSIASKSWVYRQYDSQVQANTVFKPGEADAALIRLRRQDETNKSKNFLRDFLWY